MLEERKVINGVDLDIKCKFLFFGSGSPCKGYPSDFYLGKALLSYTEIFKH